MRPKNPAKLALQRDCTPLKVATVCWVVVGQDGGSQVVGDVVTGDYWSGEISLVVMPPQVSVVLAFFDASAHTGYFTANLSYAVTTPITIAYSFADGSAASGKTVTVEVATRDGPAIAGVNYVGVTIQTITFDPGKTEKDLDVSTILDPLRELDDAIF